MEFGASLLRIGARASYSSSGRREEGAGLKPLAPSQGSLLAPLARLRAEPGPAHPKEGLSCQSAGTLPLWRPFQPCCGTRRGQERGSLGRRQLGSSCASLAGEAGGPWPRGLCRVRPVLVGGCALGVALSPEAELTLHGPGQLLRGQREGGPSCPAGGPPEWPSGRPHFRGSCSERAFLTSSWRWALCFLL